ncbi:MAG: glycoside hydrolase family 127 protein, partial [Pedobacter sp.]
MIQQNNYPWDGALSIQVDPATATDLNLKIRIPGWAQNQAVPSDLYSYQQPLNKGIRIMLNGKAIDYTMKQGYAVLSRKR